jgi:peroxiredoxin
MSLSEILAEASAQAMAAMPPDAVATLRKAIADLEASGVGNDALRAGDMLPDAVLTNPAGADVRIRDLLARGPLIVTFYRGSWCPYCNLELRAYQDILSEIERAGAQLVAVTPQKPDVSLSTIEKNALKFAVLTDNGNAFARALRITFELSGDLRALYERFGLDLPAQNPGAGWSLPIPATYVADRDGKIVLAYVERDYTTRLEPAAALAALTSL